MKMGDTEDVEMSDYDSSFYGDEETMEAFGARAMDYEYDGDAHQRYWKDTHPRSLSTIAYKNAPRLGVWQPTQTNKFNLTSKPCSEQKVQEEPSRHPRDRMPLWCWQMNESVTQFLNRLPPSTSQASQIGPWIYAGNPNAYSATNGPNSERRYTTEDAAALIKKGQGLFHSFENLKSNIEADYRTQGSGPRGTGPTAPLTRKINGLRRELEVNLFKAARNTNVITGKWMLFPSPIHVDDVWAAVAGATIKGNLGIGAKVATNDKSGSNGSRLVAIYTRDHENKEDVRRVLMKLIELGLVERKADRPIYYKCDAYTELGVDSKNPYGLRASRYSSNEVLGW